jgi:hypothetical protein
MTKEFVVMRTVKIVPWIFLLAIALFLGACQSQPPTADVPVRQLLLNFFAIVKATPEEEVQMEIGVSGVNEVSRRPGVRRLVGTAG